MAEATPAMQKRQRSAGALIARQESQREHRRKRQALEDWAEAEAELASIESELSNTHAAIAALGGGADDYTMHAHTLQPEPEPELPPEPEPEPEPEDARQPRPLPLPRGVGRWGQHSPLAADESAAAGAAAEAPPGEAERWAATADGARRSAARRAEVTAARSQLDALRQHHQHCRSLLQQPLPLPSPARAAGASSSPMEGADTATDEAGGGLPEQEKAQRRRRAMLLKVEKLVESIEAGEIDPMDLEGLGPTEDELRSGWLGTTEGDVLLGMR